MAQTRSIASHGGATVAMARTRLVPIAPLRKHPLTCVLTRAQLQDAVASVDAAHTVAPKAFTPLDAHAHEERRLFIGGLPPKATEKSVVDRFGARARGSGQCVRQRLQKQMQLFLKSLPHAFERMHRMCALECVWQRSHLPRGQNMGDLRDCMHACMHACMCVCVCVCVCVFARLGTRCFLEQRQQLQWLPIP